MSAEPAIIGRSAELERLDALIDGIVAGGAALTIVGSAGIGKTTLLTHARARAVARGHRVLEATGLLAESELPFAGLHQVLAPVLGDVDALSTPRRSALLAAFGLVTGAAPERFLIAMATLELLCEVAATRPSVILLEDVQWLDRPSLDALAFVSRRVHDDAIVVIATQREGLGETVIRPELALAPLRLPDASALLDQHTVALSDSERRLVLAEAAGNPLALVELPALRQGAPGVDLPLNARLEEAFGARLADLPNPTQRLLLLAALDEGGSVADVLSAAEDGKLTIADLLPAVEAGLIELSAGRLRFHHPLMRSAVPARAGAGERLAAHWALARALEQTPFRGVWHRAAASVGRDEEVAEALEDAARQAHRQGALGVAVSAYERAAALSERPHADVRRRLTAAELAVELGRLDIAARVLSAINTGRLDAIEEGRLRWLRETLSPSRSDERSIAELVGASMRTRAAGEPRAAVDLLVLAASRCLWTEISDTTRATLIGALDPEVDEPRCLAVLAYAASRERGAEVRERLAAWQPGAAEDPDAIQMLGTAASVVGALPDAARILAVASAGLRAQGRLGVLPRVLALQAWSAAHSGAPELALEPADEASRLGIETGNPLWAAGGRAAAAYAHAQRGDEEATERLASEAEARALPLGVHFMLSLIQAARGLSALGGGRHAEAYGHLRRLFEPADPAGHPRMGTGVIGDLAEAATQCGRREEAAALLEVLAARQPASPWATIGLQHAAAVLAADDRAEERFTAGLALPDLERWPFARARLELAYGMWLRRQRRAADSRPRLRAARDAFDALRADPWSTRARTELRASGETSRRREPAAWDQLTPQELHIARLAADGLTNREIGERLFLSHRTVSTHLHRSFPKLGVSSRGELARVLAALAAVP